MSDQYGQTPDKAWNSMLKYLLAFVILAMSAVMIRGCRQVWHEQDVVRQMVCENNGMELVYSSVSHGKYSETFYMCRDKDGVIHALQEVAP